jgi:3-hydroxyacyl-CoA dehydrogenase
MARYFPGRFSPSTACARLLAAGLKGRKSGAGFYRYENGAEFVNDVATVSLVRARRGAATDGEQERESVADHLMSVMTAEAKRCLDEGVVKSPDDVDFALLNGAGFPAFRGGLFRIALPHVPSAFSRALSIST